MATKLIKRRPPEPWPVEKPKKPKRPEPKSYRDGAEGFIVWCDHHVYIPIYPEGSDVPEYHRLGNLPDVTNPETGKSYRYIWDQQKEVARRALKMENGRFYYNLIVLCWMRGEGKSLFACLILLWKFFNWPKQTITLGANSKDQVKFVHFDIMSDIVLNSPRLLAAVGGKSNVQQKEIRIKNSKGEIKSYIRAISSFSGIVSNINHFSFSEIFDMKNPKFFVQLYGSIRNVPNAFGVIDSTVSDKQHILYKLHENANVTKKSKRVFFSYRYSAGPDGNVDDYWNPNMTRTQLDDYKTTFPFGEFERYFLNLWEAGQVRVFTDVMIDEIFTYGVDRGRLNHKDIVNVLEKKHEYMKRSSDMADRGLTEAMLEQDRLCSVQEARIKPMDKFYRLRTEHNSPRHATLADLQHLSEVFDTDWAVIAGADFGDPYAVSGLARTILTVVAKGIIGSKSDPSMFVNQDADPKYIYVILMVVNVEDHSLGKVKKLLDYAHNEYVGIDAYCAERFGTWDSGEWCEDRGIYFEPVFPSYARQKEAFKALYEMVREGRLKSANVVVPGSKSENLVREEFEVFMHDWEKKWFGSPQKMEKRGVQDDFMFSLGWCMYGGRELTINHLRPRRQTLNFGWSEDNKSLAGAYT